MDAVFGIMQKLIKIVLDQKNRDVYDKLSMRFVKTGFFTHIVHLVVNSKEKIKPKDFMAVARILELCACHIEGI